MKKDAGRRNSSSTEDEFQQAVAIFNARQQFFISVLNMRWQLAITVVIPVVAGVKLDRRFGTSPSLTLTGCTLSAVMASMVVWRAAMSVNQALINQEKKLNKRNKRVK